MRFQSSELSLSNPSGLAYLQSSATGHPVGNKEAFREFGRYVIQAIVDERGPAADARIPVALVVDKALKTRSTLDLAPMFGQLRSVAKSFSANKTDAEIVRSAAWFYNNIEKPAKAKAGAASGKIVGTETEILATPPESGAPSGAGGGPIQWVKDHPAATAGIVVGVVALGAGAYYFLAQSSASK